VHLEIEVVLTLTAIDIVIVYNWEAKTSHVKVCYSLLYWI